MSAFDTATKFFHACESLKGWEGCKDFATADATFAGQCEPLTDIHTLEAYCGWMEGLGKGPLQGCTYEINGAAYDEANSTAIFFATITGTHVGDGGPVPPTNKTTKTDYVYAMKMNDQGKVESMTKVWNAPWTLKELGWM